MISPRAPQVDSGGQCGLGALLLPLSLARQLMWILRPLPRPPLPPLSLACRHPQPPAEECLAAAAPGKRDSRRVRRQSTALAPAAGIALLFAAFSCRSAGALQGTRPAFGLQDRPAGRLLNRRPVLPRPPSVATAAAQTLTLFICRRMAGRLGLSPAHRPAGPGPRAATPCPPPPASPPPPPPPPARPLPPPIIRRFLAHPGGGGGGRGEAENVRGRARVRRQRG